MCLLVYYYSPFLRIICLISSSSCDVFYTTKHYQRKDPFTDQHWLTCCTTAMFGTGAEKTRGPHQWIPGSSEPKLSQSLFVLVLPGQYEQANKGNNCPVWVLPPSVGIFHTKFFQVGAGVQRIPYNVCLKRITPAPLWLQHSERPAIHQRVNRQGCIQTPSQHMAYCEWAWTKEEVWGSHRPAAHSTAWVWPGAWADNTVDRQGSVSGTRGLGGKPCPLALCEFDMVSSGYFEELKDIY